MADTDPLPETEAGPEQAKPSPRRNWWVQTLGMSFLIFCAVLGWFVYQRGPWFLYPKLPAFESIRQDDAPARRLVEKLGLPELPDLTRIDQAGAEHFYNALLNVRNYSRTARHYGVLGRVYEAQGSREKALEVYRRAIALDDSDYRWHYHLAYAAQLLGKADVARPEFERTIELNPAYSPAYMRLGNLLLETGKTDEAAKMFNAYVERRPGDMLGHLALGRVARERGDWQGVVDQVTAAPKLGKLGRQLLATAYRNLGQTEEAEKQSRLVPIENDVPQIEDELETEMIGLQTSETIINDRYEFYFDQGRYREALPLAKQLVDKTRGTPEHGGAWARLAECHRQLGEYDEALIAVGQAKKFSPEDPEPHVIHGMIRLVLQEPVLALRAAEEAIKLRKGFIPGHFLRGQVLLFLSVQEPGRLRLAAIADSPLELLRKAVDELRFVAQVEPANYEGLLHLGCGLALQSNYSEAVKVLEQATEIRPDQQDLARYLAAAKARNATVFWPATRPASSPATQTSTGPASHPATGPMKKPAAAR